MDIFQWHELESLVDLSEHIAYHQKDQIIFYSLFLSEKNWDWHLLRITLCSNLREFLDL